MTLRNIFTTGLLILLVTSCKTTDLSHGKTAPLFTEGLESRILSAYLTGDLAMVSDMAGGTLFDHHPLGELKADYPKSIGKFTSYGLASESRGNFQTRQMTTSVLMIVRTFALKTENYRTLFVRFYIAVGDDAKYLMKLDPDLNMIK
tara:strand:- start:280 stop:720 length:441 start_codon:yes stop_codon:yes gene_type:complete